MVYMNSRPMTANELSTTSWGCSYHQPINVLQYKQYLPITKSNKN